MTTGELDDLARRISDALTEDEEETYRQTQIGKPAHEHTAARNFVLQRLPGGFRGDHRDLDYLTDKLDQLIWGQ